ncbi:hypothetical protein T484DRAFT_1894193, partial [Baffinella frigidus]
MVGPPGAWRVVAVLGLVALSSVAGGGGTESVLDLTIRDGWQGIGVRGTGARLWPGSRLLSAYIAENPACVSGKNVAEIGCGLGLCSLVAARCGAAQGRVQTAVLCFGNEHHHGTFHTVLASDVVYAAGGRSGGFEALVACLMSLTDARSTTLVAYTPRYRREKAFWECLRPWFTVQRIALSPALATQECFGGVMLLRLTRKSPRVSGAGE